MMINEKDKFIYVSTMKCGTNTMYLVLPEYGFVSKGKFHDKRYNKYIEGNIKDYRLFTLCRNPYTRAISIWWTSCIRDKQPTVDKYFFRRDCERLGYNPDVFNDFLQWVLDDREKNIGNFGLIASQREWHESIPFDYYIRIEDVVTEFNKLPFVNEPLEELPRRNFGNFNGSSIDDIFTDDEIRFLINSVEINEGRYDQGKIGGISNTGGYAPEVRRSLICWLDANDQSIQFFYKKLTEAINLANQNFFRYSIIGIEPTQFTKYVQDDESYYNWHKDEEPTGFKNGSTRKLSSVLFLSEPSDYEGGELQICKAPNDILTVEPKKGRIVFFPSYTIHKVNPVTKGVRYTAVNWARGPAFV